MKGSGVKSVVCGDLQAHLQSGGMSGSVLDPVDKYGNESFTYRQRVRLQLPTLG